MSQVQEEMYAKVEQMVKELLQKYYQLTTEEAEKIQKEVFQNMREKVNSVKINRGKTTEKKSIRAEIERYKKMEQREKNRPKARTKEDIKIGQER
ncbi:hypothetical protein [Streptococcus anginosus]|jgi:hypothetical protein|uniref:hypothetical protein n=1 Tax=Streptococcus anginosus TaxID=1328 RepID=UPI0029C4A28F|nr:hypothetical protein [Streptococcus anginosus]MDX5006264.1 hypothetical protein [Streptococcus anginosus]MDX5054533.1 hypothetical protein [Streptococcus anginosus]MDX5056396.1 hypothetical protein [Streptococcus anginosus]MDX5058279.1 hypothetical protein [Streptococcus anginosus]